MVRYTGKKSITKLFSIIDLVKEDTFRTVMLKIEGVKCIFVWFATPKIVTRHSAEEKGGRNIRFSRDLPSSDLRSAWFQHDGAPRTRYQVSNTTFGTHSSNKSSGMVVA
ncbi:hypothetical protein AVEN_176149-1 [Araneus ventricosus]|uniref:Uncharacterized protein n=1 Tax=Araneus ventricosus TaxID=182803 RepID=A0A4Y2F945_ARAVE|nr:hypothetical protein AVEN_176149-1 [Araneus ventricosus]